MNEIDRLEHIIGQVAALKTFCVTVVATYPNPVELSKCLSTLAEVTMAKTLGGAASESVLADIESVLADLKDAASKRLADGA